MGAAPVQFRSVNQVSSHITPTAAVRQDTSALDGIGAVGPLNAVIMGDALGGEPGKLIRFTDPNVVVNTLKGGPLLDAVRFALSPSQDFEVGSVFGMRTNPATKSFLDLQTSAVDAIRVSDKDFGVDGNSIQISVAAGTTEGKKIIVQKVNAVETFDNIIRKYFDIEYIGAGSPAVITISATQLTTTITGGPGGENLTILFSVANTIQKVIDAIRAVPAYTVTEIGDLTAPSTELDEITTVDIDSTVVVIEGTNAEIIETLNNQSNIVIASFESGFSRLIPDDIGLTFLTGGAEGTTTTVTLTQQLSDNINQPVDFMSLVSGDAALQDVVKAHIQFSNGVFGKSEKVGYFGEDDPFTTTKTTAITNAKARAIALNQADVSHCINGFTRRDAFGVIREYSAIYRAAMVAGLKSVLPEAEPYTNKRLDVIESQFSFTEGETDDLILAGVDASNVQAGSGETRNVRSVTTFQGTNDLENENSLKFSILRMSKEVRQDLEAKHKGKKGLVTRLLSIENDFEELLADFEDREIITPNPNDPIQQPAFKDVLVTIDGSKVEAGAFITVVSPINFIFITLRFTVPLSLG